MPRSMRRGKHWAVLIYQRHLERTDCRYHEWFAPGVTACNRKWRIAGYNIGSPDPPAVWVDRKNAEKFAQPCKVCEHVTASTGVAA